VAVVEGEQAAPALQAEICSFEFSSPAFVWSCVRP